MRIKHAALGLAGLFILAGAAIFMDNPSGLFFLLKTLGTGLVLLAAQALGMYGLGSWLMAMTWLRIPRNGFFGVFAVSLGMGAFTLIFLLLGALGLYYPWVAWLFLALAAVLGAVQIWAQRSELRSCFNHILESRIDLLSLALLGLLLANLAYPLFSDALMPPYQFDEIAYHLPIPQIFIENHGITYIPFIPHSNWPLGVEMLYTFHLLLGAELQVHLVGWLALAMLATGIFILARRISGTHAGFLAAVLFSSTPVVVTLAGSAMIEVPLTLFTFCALAALLCWIEAQQDSYLWLSALFAGLAAGAKLNAATYAAGIGIFVLLRSVTKSGWRTGFKTFILFGLVAGACVLPWYIKSWLAVGNPFWPFLPQVFGAQNWDAIGQQYFFDFIRAPNMPLTPLNWLTGLYQLAANPGQFGSFRYDFGWTFLAFLPFAAGAYFLKTAGRRLWLWSGGLFLMLYTLWFFATHQTRFLMPALPLLAVLAGVGAAGLYGYLRRGWPRLALAVVLLAALLAGRWFFNANDIDFLRSRWGVAVGAESRHAFLAREIPGYPVFPYVHDNLPLDAYLLLGIFESRGYYLGRNYFWANPTSQRVVHWEDFETASDLRAFLLAQGFTHYLYNRSLDRLLADGPVEGEIFWDLADSSELVFERPPIYLYRLSR